METIPVWARRTAIIVAVVTLAIGGVTWWDWSQLQLSATDENKRKFDATLEFAKAWMSVVGTSATITTGVVLYLNYKNAEEKLIHEKEKSKKDADIAQSRLITERFSKAVEQLGSEKMEVRIGAIYSLERIAKDSPDDHWTVIEVLTAFIRERSPNKLGKTSKTFASFFLQKNKQDEKLLLPITTDIRAALTVIGRRDTSRERSIREKRIDLSHANLTEAFLYEADLRNVNLFAANLTKSNLSKANLSNAILSNSLCQNSIFVETKLNAADLQNVNFNGAYLLKAKLIGANLERAKFNTAYLKFSKLNKAKLIRADLSGATLDSASFVKADLYRTNFYNCKLGNTDFRQAVLELSDLSFAILSGAKLSQADLRGARLMQSTLFKSDLKQANLLEANLQGVVGWTEDHYRDAKLCGTTMPDGTICDRDCEELSISSSNQI